MFDLHACRGQPTQDPPCLCNAEEEICIFYKSNQNCLNLLIMERLVCVHFTCFVSTFTHSLSQLEINKTVLHQSCYPHGSVLVRVSGNKERNTVFGVILHTYKQILACVSRYMTQDSLIESSPFIIQSEN